MLRQIKGLTISNDLSQVLADIATNKAAILASNSLSPSKASFISKYVDDFVGAMDEESMNVFEERMASIINGLILKRTDETNSGEVSYLDMMLNITPEREVETKWWQKECSSRRILDYHSHHPMSMKRSIVRQFVKHAIEVTSHRLQYKALINLKSVLKRSSYPVDFISRVIKSVLNEMGDIVDLSIVGDPDPSINVIEEIRLQGNYDLTQRKIRLKGERKEGKKSEKRYISFPYISRRTTYEMNVAIRNLKMQCSLAPSSIRPNSAILFSKLKGKKSPEDIKDAVFTIKCNNCNFATVGRSGHTDLRSSINKMLGDQRSAIGQHIEENRSHNFDEDPHDIKKCRSKREMEMMFKFRQAKMKDAL